MDIGKLNDAWVNQLIDTFASLGIDYFCCGAGSRSTPLLLAIARHPKHLYCSHFDERGVCFHALGYAKATRKPAVVVATSGTAAGNLLPGIMEAYNERIPLIVLTADRPPELRDCGANQTCDQIKLFSNHVRWQVDLPCPDMQLPKNYLSSTLSHAVAMSQSSPAGPVHINCMLREPLFSELSHKIHIEPTVSFAQPVLHPAEDAVDFWAQTLSTQRNGVIIASESDYDLSDAIFSLADRLKWPVFADILSSPRKWSNHPLLIHHFDPILKSKTSIKADAIIQFGDRYVSKILGQWLEKQTPDFYLHISNHTMRQDPFHLVTHRIHACPRLFVQKVLENLPLQEEDAWLHQWNGWNESCKELLSEFFANDPMLTEPSIIPQIASLISEDWALFLANSMPIRDTNQFFCPNVSCGPIFGNRGVSGIDGNIATAAGIAQGTKKPTLALLGDLAFLHDLNSLAYLSKIDYPLVLCVVNNGGGGIFSFLPIGQKKENKEAFETVLATAHEISFAPAAELFGIPYFQPDTLSELSELFLQQKKHPRSCIIEITTDRAQNVTVHQQIVTAVRTCLNSAHSQEEIPAFLH